MNDKKTALVVSAHSADFVWRCGGAIALHTELGYDVSVVCLSYGERGESAKLWKQEGMTLEKVKTERRIEAENAAKALGVADIQFFDLGDYPLELDREAKYKLVDVIRKTQPAFSVKPLPDRPLQHRSYVCHAGNTGSPHDRSGLGPQSGRESSGRTAALSVRAASDRADGMEAGRVPRHLFRLGEKEGSHRMYEGSGASLALLYQRR